MSFCVWLSPSFSRSDRDCMQCVSSDGCYCCCCCCRQSVNVSFNAFIFMRFVYYMCMNLSIEHWALCAHLLDTLQIHNDINLLHVVDTKEIEYWVSWTWRQESNTTMYCVHAQETKEIALVYLLGYCKCVVPFIGHTVNVSMFCVHILFVVFVFFFAFFSFLFYLES